MKFTIKASFFLLLQLLFLAACKTPQTAQSPTETTSEIQNGQDEKADKIIFLVFNISKNDDKPGADLSNFQLYETPGLLKEKPAQKPPAEAFLMGILENELQTETDTFYLEHPLYRYVEYVNEHQQLERKFIELDESEFFVRFQKEEYEMLHLFEFTEHIKNEPLGTFRF